MMGRTRLFHEFVGETQPSVWPKDGNGCDMTARSVARFLFPKSVKDNKVSGIHYKHYN